MYFNGKMIGDEVILISDSESSEHSLVLLNPPSNQQPQQPSSDTNENKTITISTYTNQSTERCPVTWNNSAVKKSRIKYLDSESFLSPSPRMKVSSWLFRNCETGSNNNIQNSPQTYAENKSAILIRQDYRKPDMLHALPSPSSLTYLRCNPSNLCQDSVISITSRESSATSHIQTNYSNSSKDSIKEQTLVSLSNMITPIDAIKVTCVHKKSNCTLCDAFSDTLSIKVDETKSANSPIDLEVPNKIELCEYLKLMNMNPLEGKVVSDKKNRRSSRVKNLALMSEKRALEKELNSDAQSYEKKKCTNSLDQDVKSSTGSESSKESGGSSKVSKRTNLSSASRKNIDKKTPTLRRHSDEENKVRNILDVSEDLKHYSIRTKSLQVPEVSTTSSSKIKPDKIHEVQDMKQKLLNKRVDASKNITIIDSSPSSERTSVIMTDKSFSQLNINVNSINSVEDTEKMFGFNDKLLNYVTAIDKTDFEDSFNKYISNEDINEYFRNKKAVTTNSPRNQRIKTSLNEIKPKVKKVVKNVYKKKLRIMDKFPKHDLRKFHEKLKMKRKLKMKTVKKKPMQLNQTFRLYSLRRNLTQLRSRRSLKEVGIKSILLMHEKKRRKKRFSVKSTQVTPKLKPKHFTETVLIQKSAESMEEEKRNELDVPPSDFSSLKILKLKSEIDLLKNLTPEHRKALFESKKFLIMKSKENMKAFEQGSKQDKPIKNEEIVGMDVEDAQNVPEATLNTEDCNTLPILKRVAQETQLDAELSRPTSEDLEVHTLMSSSYFTDQIIQQNSTSVEVKPLINNAVDDVLKEKWRCSTSKSTPSTNSSLQIIEPDREAVQSPTNDEVDVKSKTPLSNNENLINEEIVETTSITPDNTITTDEDADNEEEVEEYENQPEVVDISEIERTIIDCVQLVDDHETTIKSLNDCLTQPPKKQKGEEDKNNLEWDEKFDNAGRSPKSGRKAAQSYAIDLSSSNGAVMNTYYLDYNLVIVQEFLISFWNQTSLGNVLGAQDMWMPKGVTKRIVLGNGCTHKESSESVMVLDNSMAYVELWTKEHKSDKRERPVADIFVTIYLRLNGSGPVKKVLQLENIHGYANDVQYIVFKNSPFITVSWNTVNDQLTSTVVHKYQLSSDYRTVTNIVAMQPAAHYIASLHNIEDSDTLIMGCGEDKITLWHIEDGYIVATMDLMAIAQQPRTLWAKADRGFIFTLHNFNDGYFHLIATNSFDYSWKQLQIYKQEVDYENLLGICIENGLVIAFYDTGILCWSAKSGKLLIDTSSENSIFLPFGKHIVVIIENQVHVRHVLEYLVTIDDS